MIAEAEAGKVVQDLHEIAHHAPALEHRTGGIETDWGKVEVVGVEWPHEVVGAKIEGAYPIRGVGAPILEEQNPGAVRADERNGEVGDTRVADEQADVHRRNDAVRIVGEVDKGDRIVENGHGRGNARGDKRVDGERRIAQDHADIHRDVRCCSIADAHPIGASLQRRDIGLINGDGTAERIGNLRLLATSSRQRANLNGVVNRPRSGNHRDGDGETDRIGGHFNKIVATGSGSDGRDNAIARQVFLAFQKDAQGNIGADVIGGVIHHREHPLALAILSGESIQTAGAICMLHVLIDVRKIGVRPHIQFAAVVKDITGQDLTGAGSVFPHAGMIIENGIIGAMTQPGDQIADQFMIDNIGHNHPAHHQAINGDA
ncbi:MAG: hypothetical protein BWX68_02903 [Verrucomicrobia bacterium ADurb.Bin063]|nr:MAG: hypothetical protein BWX68_02903 [Verrucomicrobia bacterium ADurb.Bin063]